jgi:hypothetical protein
VSEVTITQNPFQSALLVAVNDAWRDPAIDREAPGAAKALEQYGETFDASLLPLRPGLTPTIFVVRPLRASFIAAQVEAHEALPMQRVAAFLAACQEIRVPGREPLRPDPHRVATGMGGQPYASDEWLDRVVGLFHMQTVYEIGRKALALSKLSDEGKVRFVCWGGQPATT